MLDYIRIVCAVPPVKVGDVAKNARDICACMEKAAGENADILLLPELALTGYTCGDLFYQGALHRAVRQGVKNIAACSAKYPELTVVFGLPVRINAKLYNCAAVMSRGEICGIVPKTWLTPAEKRWFASGTEAGTVWLEPEKIGLASCEDYYGIPVTTNQLFRLGEDAMVGIEICQDLMVPRPCSTDLALNGAEVILNLSASPELAGKRELRRDLVRHQSMAFSCVYAYVSAGHTESAADMVYSGHSLIAENGRILAEDPAPLSTDYHITADSDLGRIRSERLRSGYFGHTPEYFLIRDTFGDSLRSDGSLYPLRKLVFVPESRESCSERCMEIFQTQVTGLKQRLATIHANPVIGISGGLDSTLALLVAVEAVRQLGRPVSGVYGVTMPCFGTSDRTYRNSWELMEKLGITAKEISIRDAVTGHFRDIGHDISIHDGTYENSQARERTQILMDYSSTVNGIVVGTGDLSELALGWCTYNGDHMSMYAVNATVPKTLIRWIIETVAELPTFAGVKEVLRDVLDTPISPELLPPDAEGRISQQTEDLVGPYALHDFFLYHMLRFGFAPAKIYSLACRAFRDDFEPEVVKKWLCSFYRRFFTQQFKRNCMPDGVRTGTISLGPRGDWAMPSDAAASIWLEEAENL